MDNFKTLVYRRRCSKCDTLNRYAVILPENVKTDHEIMKSRILTCKACGKRVKAKLESSMPVTEFVSPDRFCIELKLDEKHRDFLYLVHPYLMELYLDKIRRTGFLGVLEIKGLSNFRIVFHFLEDRIVPFIFRNERREISRDVLRAEADIPTPESPPEEREVVRVRRDTYTRRDTRRGRNG